jgi:hypothetical protein
MIKIVINVGSLEQGHVIVSDSTTVSSLNKIAVALLDLCKTCIIYNQVSKSSKVDETVMNTITIEFIRC